MKCLLVTVLGFMAAGAFALPADHRLVTPSAVTRLRSGKVKVTYQLPCDTNDVARVVMTNDDTGDLAVAVGVVYSAQERNCRPTEPKTFFETVSPKNFGYGPDVEEYKPMPIDKK